VDKDRHPIRRWATLPLRGAWSRSRVLKAARRDPGTLQDPGTLRADSGRLAEPAELRRAWEEHGRTDRYLTLAEVRAACARALPGARVRRHLLWRYLIVWRRPG
jgi:hypothetical protein